MEKDKDVCKKVMMPSTTRRCMNLSTRPYFSPNTASPVIRKKVGALASSPLSKKSTNTESELLDDDIAKKGQPNYLKMNSMMKMTLQLVLNQHLLKKILPSLKLL
jgi:hypothetical protein